MNAPAGPAPLMLGMGWFPDQPGGLNRYFRDLHTALAAAGAAPTGVVVGPGADAPVEVYVSSDAGRPLAVRLVAFAAAARRLSGRSDLVDAHFALYALLPLLAGAGHGRPCVLHFHGPWALEGREGGQSPMAVAAKRAIERAVYRRMDRFIVLSGAFRRVLVERYGVPPWRIEVIPPGVDLERFTPGDGRERDRLGVDARSWTAVVARRLVPRMGLEVLLRSWAELPDGDRLLVVVGEGPSRPRLEGLAHELGVESNVRFTGRVGDDELRDWYRAADVCVVPSMALEGFGLVVIEALACGTPVVVTDVGGLPEAVAGLGSDTVVPSGRHETLARRLAEARDGSAPLPSPTECRAHAERFTWHEAVQRHRRLYRSTVARGPRTRARVVYLDHCAELSGGELALATTLRALRRVDAHVILAQEGPLVTLLTQAGISVEVLPLAATARGVPRGRLGGGAPPIAAGLLAGGYAARLALRLRRLRPDLVHANSLKAAIYGLPAARSAGIPAIWHLREHLTPDCLPGGALRLMRLVSRLPSAIIANSLSSRATLPEVRCPVEVIASPVRLEPVHEPRTARNGSGALTIGVVGRVAPIKGQHLFLDAFARAFPDGGDRAVLVGAPLFGELDYERRLQDDVARLGLQGRVSFRGFRTDVAHEMSQLDVLVLSSVVPEGLGQCAIEGMASGLPVVVPDIGGPPEVVRDGVTGLVYRAGDPEAMAEALRRLKEDPRLRQRLAGNGPRAVAPFAPETVASRVEDLYARVLAKPGGRGPS